MMRQIFIAAIFSSIICIASAADMKKIFRPRNPRAGRKLQPCKSYATAPGCSTNTVNWDNGGGSDSEWMNKNNWYGDCLPGAKKSNRLIMAANDAGTVHCPATHMDHNVDLEMRSGATLVIKANLTIGGKLVLKTNAVLTQSSQSMVSVGGRLYLASKYELSDQAQLTVGTYVYVPTNGELVINDTSRVSGATTSAATDSQFHGLLKYRLGSGGAGLLTVNGKLIIGDKAKLEIDASAYDSSSGPSRIQLIKYTSGTGSFAPGNVNIVGLLTTPQIKSESDGIYLELSHDVPDPTPSPKTKSPTPNPAATSPTWNPVTSSPIKVPSASPVMPTTSSPTVSPTKAPSVSPVTSAPTTFNPTSSTTANPTTPTTHLTTTIVALLGVTGLDSITPAVYCPAQETTKLMIDGSSYTGGAGTISLYQCASIGFEPMNIKLVGFSAGLWFDIKKSNSNSVDLIIKDLDSYSEFDNGYRYRGDYPFQTSQEHYPRFSWDKIPRYINFRKNTPFTSDEIKSIATNNYLSWYGLYAKEKILAMAKSIKSYNPNYKMILYWNSYGYWGEEIDSFDEGWLKHTLDANGNRVYEYDKSGNRRLYNHTIPEMREWWINYAMDMNAESLIDGVFSDATRTPEDTLHSQMIMQLAESLPVDSLKMGNFLRQRDVNGNRWRMDYQDGSYLENVHSGPNWQDKHETIIVSMQLAREALWKGKLVMWNGSPMNCAPPCKVTQDAMSEYIKPTLAEYLVIAEEYAYYSFNLSPNADLDRWKWDTSSMEEFDRPLGKPLGPPVRMGNKFTRHFEHVSVMLDTETSDAVLEWA